MPRGLFDVPIEERLRPYLDYTAQSIPLVDIDKELKGISDALVGLPQDLIDAGRRFVTVIQQVSQSPQVIPTCNKPTRLSPH